MAKSRKSQFTLIEKLLHNLLRDFPQTIYTHLAPIYKFVRQILQKISLLAKIFFFAIATLWYSNKDFSNYSLQMSKETSTGCMQTALQNCKKQICINVYREEVMGLQSRKTKIDRDNNT